MFSFGDDHFFLEGGTGCTRKWIKFTLPCFTKNQWWVGDEAKQEK